MTETTVVTDPEQFHAVAADAPAGARVPVEIRTVVDDRGLPTMQMALYDCLAAWEGAGAGETMLRITACPKIPQYTDEAALDACYDRALATACELARQAHVDDPAVGPAPAAADEAKFRSTCGREQFRERASRAKEHIREGDRHLPNPSPAPVREATPTTRAS